MRHPWWTITALLLMVACTTSVTITRGKLPGSQPSPPPAPPITPSLPTAILDQIGAQRPATDPKTSPQPSMSQPPASQGGGGGGGGNGGGPTPRPSTTSTPMPFPSLVWIRPTTLPSLPPSPSPPPSATSPPLATPTPRIVPIDAGTWRLTVMVKEDDHGPATTWELHYGLACHADGRIDVDGGAIPQTHAWADGPAWLGWQGNHLKFVDASSDIDGAAWHLYYELTASSPTTASGSAVLIGPAYTWYFDTVGQRLP